MSKNDEWVVSKNVDYLRPGEKFYHPYDDDPWALPLTVASITNFFGTRVIATEEGQEVELPGPMFVQVETLRPPAEYINDYMNKEVTDAHS